MALIASALLFLLIGGMAVYQSRLAPAPEEPTAVGNEPGAVTSTEAVTAGGPVTGTGTPAAAGVVAGMAGTGPSVAPGTAANSETSTAPGAVTAAEPAPAFSWPLTGAPMVVKAFGSVDESLGDYRLYDAVALEATPGQPVVAAAAGRVVAVEEHPVDGMTVVLEHPAGQQTRYAGLAEVTVATGDAVSAGEAIGQVGRPGPLRRSLGPHLAFSLLIEGEPVDPELYMEP